MVCGQVNISPLITEVELLEISERGRAAVLAQVEVPDHALPP